VPGLPQQGSQRESATDYASADVPTGIREGVHKGRLHQRIWEELSVMDFDMIAGRYPVLIDLMGIASVMLYTDSTKRKVVFDYISSIVDRLSIPKSVLKDFAEVLYLEVVA
jgi:hypothetical protein